MYQRGDESRTAPSRHEAPAGPGPDSAARLALARVRKLRTAYVPGLPCDPRQMQADLAAPFADAAQERERRFALGWLAWLEGNPGAAEPLLAEAVGRAREAGALDRLAEAAYWCARVRLRLGRAEAIAEYEAVLRTLGGSPQATAWFVDLLWRAGRVDRAEQVWKSVRGNRRVMACPEGPLLEARVLLRRGEIGPAERVLNETTPANGVVWVERLLLLAWAAFTAKQSERGRMLLAQAREGPYPAAALDTSEDLGQRRAAGELTELVEENIPSWLREFLRGQEARLAGDREGATAAYRAALAVPAVQPFARYALARLGQEDPAGVLAAQPGLFLAVRCRARLAQERFRRRQMTPAEFLDAFGPAAAAGYRDAGAEHLRRLALALGQRQVDAAGLRALAATGGDGMRAAIELAVRRLPPREALDLLLEWAREEGPAIRAGLGPVVGRQLLRLLLLDRANGVREPPVAEEGVLVVLQRLLPDEPLLALVGGEQGPEVEKRSIYILELAERLAGGQEIGESWREEVRGLLADDRLKSLAQALLLQEAAGRSDAAAVAALLDEADLWRRFRPAPPHFVLRALANVVAAHPTHPALRRSLDRWLSLWDVSALGSTGGALAVQAGHVMPRYALAGPLPGVPAVAWWLHQASRALGREDPAEALLFVRRAIHIAPELASSEQESPETRLVREALPDLERLARAQGLASMLYGWSGTTTPPALLVDAVDLLADSPQGLALLHAPETWEFERSLEGLASLMENPDLSPRLAHHLALLELRLARGYDEHGESAEAESHWRRAWRWWLRFLAEPPTPEARDLLLDHLLTGHRHRLNDLLARGAVEAARRLWGLVQELPTLATAEGLREELAARVERFRDDLATEYLLTTREAMRYGTIPEGWRSDYAKGLDGLRRLLSLDRDNRRLLTALVEVYTDWFLDLYHQGDAAGLREQVDRCTPFALHLARLVEDRPAELAARAALADFCKFRGFLSRDRAEKAALYREALRFNPANDNVRALLAELEGPHDPASEGQP